MPAGSSDPVLGASGEPLHAPRGMGDLLPPEAAARRALTRRVLRTFELGGYELVTPPVIEHADVVQRGAESLESRDMLRFVEPESGEVVVLRPDITPQIARIVATHLASRPAPLRLCYEGRIFRRTHGRARSHRQITQAGVEHIGAAGVEADAEIVALAIQACEEAGLAEFRVELSDIRLVRSLLDEVPAALRATVSDMVAQKDGASIRTLARGGHVDRALAEQLGMLLDCYGGHDVLDRVEGRFRGREAKAALSNLRAILDELRSLGLAERVVFDVSETRGLSYYTGMHFNVLAEGPGEVLGAGGRYDGLLKRFGFDAPATGFALDLGHLQATLREHGRGSLEARELRVAVSSRDPRKARELAMRLRRADIVAATLPAATRDQCLAFAHAWGYDALVLAERGTCTVLRAAAEAGRSLSDADIETIQRLATGSRRADTR